MTDDWMTQADKTRLKRIMELRKCNEIQALRFALVCGWLGSEKIQREKTK